MALNSPLPPTPVSALAEQPFRRARGLAVPFEGEGGTFTQSWYPICMSSAATADFVRGFDFLDGRVIVFRDAGGQAHVMSAYCPHLGADLSIGDMVNGQVRCVYHHWRYGPDGRCAAMPSKDPIPAAARLFKFPVCEKYGIVWAYNGLEPHYDLPSFAVPDADLVFKDGIAVHIKGSAHQSPFSSPAESEVTHFKTATELQSNFAEVSIADVGKDPDIQAKIRLQGFTPTHIGLADFDGYIRNDMKRLAPLLATIGQAN